MPGLYAAGTARSLEPRVYAGGFALITTAVTGYLAGQAAAGDMAGDLASPDENEIARIKKDLFAPLGRKGPDPKEILVKIQTVMFPYQVSIIKNGTALQKAATAIKKIAAKEIPLMAAGDPHYLLKLREVEAIAFVSELFAEASLLRKETRAGHYREDYPKMDSAGPAWLFLEKDGRGKKRLYWQKVHVDKYPVPLTRFYQNNFNFGARS